MRARLFFALGCLWMGCGPSRTVDRVFGGGPGSATERPPVSLPDPEALPRPAADASSPTRDTGPPPGSLAGPGSVMADAGAPPADASPRPPDRPAPPDATPRPPDAPPDTPPPPPDAPPPPRDRPPDTAPPCPPEPAADRIADFEDGSLETLQVGTRGGTPWRVVSTAPGVAGTLEAAEVPVRCGSTGTMRFSVTSDGLSAPIVRAQLTVEDPAAPFFDASGYRAIRVWLRSVPAGRARIKLSDANSTRAGGVCTGCANHFLQQVDVDGELRPYVVRFADMKQEGPDEIVPALRQNALFAVEIVPPKSATFDLLIDDVSFVR
jgi:hypothetical protein